MIRICETFLSQTNVTDALLSVSGLRLAYGDHVVVDGLGFELAAGRIACLLGPSGCGKTTMLRMIAGFEQPDRGDISLAGGSIADLPPERRDIGIVFQDYALFPNLNVLDNVIFAMLKTPKAEKSTQAMRLIAMLGLTGLENRFPDQLSGGQQQRVALARSFAAEPRLLLLDEPFSNLDAALRQNTRREIRAILKSTGLGVVFVTHDQEDALSFADKICVMREGLVEQFGPPMQLYDRPANAFVATFLGRTNLLQARADGSHAQTPFGQVELDGEAQGEVLLSLRPEHIALDTARESDGAAVVAYREFKGHDITYWVQIGGASIQVDTDYRHRFNPGERVTLTQRGKAVVLEQ